MTYIVFDGTTVIADRIVSLQSGSGVFGRREIRKDGMVSMSKSAPAHEVYFNDTSKLIFPPKATYKGEKIKLFALAGSAGPLASLSGALLHEVDLDDIMKVDVSIMPPERRYFFNGKSNYFILTEDGKGHHAYRNEDSISCDNVRWAHLGSGRPVVDSVRTFIPGILQDTAPDLTALEAFVLAAGQTETVSMNFDYYHIPTGEYKTNQQLSERQMEIIMNRIQSRIKLSEMYEDLPYVNKLRKAAD